MKDKVCQCCVMDTTDPEIVFFGAAGCSKCKDARKRIQIVRNDKTKLREVAGKIKRAGKGKKYDCIIGVSGGVDSSFVAHMVKKLGLRPLAVHLDNGWNSEISVQNIKNLLEKLDIDLYTYVIDWEEFRDLQLAFLKASTPDSEIPTDHAIGALLYRIAAKHGIKYIVDGLNINSEAILPRMWSHGHLDWKYIQAIQKQFGHKRLITFPHCGRWAKIYYENVLGIERVHILNYISYDKERAKRYLQQKYDWIDYGGKHYESIYTKFFQAYILPEKFGYDKRKSHLSSLIAAGQLTREEALRELEQPLYEEDQLKTDLSFFLHKMKLTQEEFDNIMKSPKKTYWDYPNYENDWIHKHFGV